MQRPVCMNDAPNSNREQVILYALIAAIGVIPVIIALRQGGVFGSEATIGLVMLALAIVGLLAMWRIARKQRPRR
ncbi:MAG: hypothetical protein ABI467_16035 [Kofleriaceae bacterium]